MDGGDILADFCGVIAAEIRFCPRPSIVAISVRSNILVSMMILTCAATWKNGRHDITGVTNIYTHNQQRASRR